MKLQSGRRGKLTASSGAMDSTLLEKKVQAERAISDEDVAKMAPPRAAWGIDVEARLRRNVQPVRVAVDASTTRAPPRAVSADERALHSVTVQSVRNATEYSRTQMAPPMASKKSEETQAP